VIQSALAVAGGVAASQAAVIAKGAIVMAMWSKAKVAVAACVALAVLGTGTGVVIHLSHARAQQAPVTQAQPAPADNSFQVRRAPPAPPAPSDPNWRARFEQVYRLEDGEILKRIAPPFIPERMDWYWATNRAQAQAMPRGPDYITFYWDGKLHNWGMGFGLQDGQRVGELLASTLALKSYEFEDPGGLLGYRLPGDFIIRRSAEPIAQLDALCQVVRAAGGPPIRFTQQARERPVIVASGQYKFHPLKDSPEQESVHFYVGQPDSTTGGGGGSGTAEEFLKELGSRLGMRVFDETTGAKPERVNYRYHRSMYPLANEKPGAEHDDKVHKLLDAVTAQTELQFKIETRPVPVWVAEAGDPNNGL
jgi:hypothetical protein